MSDERDREVAAAWREASREEPPPALDAAIRAEARRAVGAAPGRRRHRRWRYPVAAAATVAVLAFGIARMTSHDQIEPILVADQAPRQAPASAPPEQRAESATATAPSAMNEIAPAPKAATDAKVASRNQAQAPRESPPMPAKTAPVQKQEAAPGERFAAPPSERGAIAQQSNAPPPASPDAKANEKLARELQTQLAERDAAVRRSAEAAAAARPLAKVSARDETKAKQAGAESVEAWIARIRDLKSRDQLDAAAKEIAKFRETYGDRADALLPEDLRNVAAPRP
jgi:hypothetical protein